MTDINRHVPAVRYDDDRMSILTPAIRPNMLTSKPVLFTKAILLATALISAMVAPSVAATVEVPALSWAACPPAPEGAAGTADFQCADARVPIDHDAPESGHFTLALIKHPAQKPAERIGTIFWNPGGPNDAGTQYLPAAIEGFPSSVRDRFDIVSWDPRGMGGRTTPVVQCFDSAAEEDTFLESRFGVGPSADESALAADGKARAELNAACIAKTGDLLRHVSTADNARDLDLLRRAVGEERISYYGTSYGTFLGATYINMFPQHVRAAVLDGGVSPSAWDPISPRT